MLNRLPNRLKGYDYSLPGYYFVTICVKDRLPVFGNVLNGKMIMNEYGEIVNQCWNDLPNHYGNIILDEFVVMPEHVHGIIEIVNPYVSVYVGAGHAPPLHIQKRIRGLPIIIGSYKSAVTKYINRIDIKNNFKWQRSFYDRIIRDKNEYYKIKNYIKNNPKY